MCRHYAFHTAGYHGFVGEKVAAGELLFALFQHGQVQMAVHVGVAVSGEVFRHRYHAVVLHTFDILQAFLRHYFGIFAERARSDNGILGVGVHIHAGGEVHVYAHFLALRGYGFGHLVNKGVVADGAHHHLAGEGVGVGEAHAQTPFGIEADKQRSLRKLLVLFGLRKLFVAFAGKETQSSHFVFGNAFAEFFLLFFRGFFGGHTCHYQLADFLFQREFVHGVVHPFVAGRLPAGFLGVGSGAGDEHRRSEA